MKTTKRALTAAVLLSCSCFLAPYYAHAEENVGLHIDEEFSAKTVSSSINISADNGIGVLVSGQGNTLNIESDVISNGTNGIGLQVTSVNIGDINLQSGAAIEANGEGGIAVRFGNTTSSNETASYQSEVYPIRITNFNIQGSLVGKSAAISIDSDATVRNINILSGASIEGNITHVGSGFTNLTFGGSVEEQEPPVAMSTDDGTSNTSITFTPDPNFNMTYSGKIDGINSLKMNIVGGTLEYNGTANVKSVTINEGATLKVNGDS